MNDNGCSPGNSIDETKAKAKKKNSKGKGGEADKNGDEDDGAADVGMEVDLLKGA